MEFSTDNGGIFIGFISGHRYMQLNGSSHGDSAGYTDLEWRQMEGRCRGCYGWFC